MRHDVQQRAILLALATLLDMIDEATAEPARPSLPLRAILAFLVACGAERGICNDFWKTMVDATLGQTSATTRDYMRRTYGRTHYLGIVRSLGIKRTCPDFSQRVHRLRVTSDPETRARDAVAAMVRNAKHDREIVASKGHPRTAAARRIMKERLAAGKSADGSE